MVSHLSITITMDGDTRQFSADADPATLGVLFNLWRVALPTGHRACLDEPTASGRPAKPAAPLAISPAIPGAQVSPTAPSDPAPSVTSTPAPEAPQSPPIASAAVGGRPPSGYQFGRVPCMTRILDRLATFAPGPRLLGEDLIAPLTAEGFSRSTILAACDELEDQKKIIREGATNRRTVALRPPVLRAHDVAQTIAAPLTAKEDRALNGHEAAPVPAPEPVIRTARPIPIPNTSAIIPLAERRRIVRRAVSAFLNAQPGGGRSEFKPIWDAAKKECDQANFDDVQAVLGDLIRKRYVGVLSKGTSRLYALRQADIPIDLPEADA